MSQPEAATVRKQIVVDRADRACFVLHRHEQRKTTSRPRTCSTANYPT